MLHHSVLSDLNSSLVQLGQLTARMHELADSEGDEKIMSGIAFKICGLNSDLIGTIILFVFNIEHAINLPLAIPVIPVAFLDIDIIIFTVDRQGIRNVLNLSGGIPVLIIVLIILLLTSPLSTRSVNMFSVSARSA